MKKRIVEKHLLRIILIAAFLSVSVLGVVAGGNKSAWSQEVSEPGMGLPHDEAEYMQQLFDSGMSDEEISAAMRAEFDRWGGEENTADTQSTMQTSVPETSNTVKNTTETQKEVQKTESQPQTKPVKVYAHDFDAITDEAKDNFIHFSEDGTPDSMYLNIRAESAMNTITGRELNATTSGNETGVVNYVDSEGNVLYSWVFENWKSDDDFYLDLSAYLEPYASEELVAAYKLSLQDVTLPEGNTVKLKVQSPYADGTVVNIFTEEAGELKETGKTLTVADGCITFEFTDAISTPVMSPETLIEKSAESADEASTETSVEEVAKDAVVAEAAPAEAVLDTAIASNPETAQNNTKYIIGIICAVLVVAVGIFAVNNKRRKKNA